MRFRKIFSFRGKTQWATLLDRLKANRPTENASGIEASEFLEVAPQIDRLLTWGILNPAGPTVNSLCLVADPTGKTEMIFVKMSNPFTQLTVAYGAIPVDRSQDEIIDGVIKAICPLPEEPPWILRNAPTFVIPSNRRIRVLDAFALVYRALIVGSKIDLSSEIDRLKRFWLNPWQRIPSPAELLSSAAEILASGPRQSDLAWWENRKQIFGEWWALVTDPDHVIAEWRAIVEAWQGAIEFQRGLGSDLAKSAVRVKEGLAFHTRLLDQEGWTLKVSDTIVKLELVAEGVTGLLVKLELLVDAVQARKKQEALQAAAEFRHAFPTVGNWTQFEAALQELTDLIRSGEFDEAYAVALGILAAMRHLQEKVASKIEEAKKNT